MELEGQVREPQFLRTLVEMGREEFTGAVRLEREDVIKILYLQDGKIISASTNDPSESVDEILLRGKKVTREHIQQALTRRKQDETLGDALLTAGFITRKELRWARRHQIVEVMRSALGTPGWHYTVVPDYVSPRSAEGTSFVIEPILIELVVTDPDRKRVDERLEGGTVRLRKSPGFDDRYPGLGLNQDADRVAALVDGKKTAAEIAAEAGGNGFMNLKLLAALRVLGLLEINPKAQEQLEIFLGAEPELALDLLPGLAPEANLAIPDWEVESIPGVSAVSPEPDPEPDSELEPPAAEWEAETPAAWELEPLAETGEPEPEIESGSASPSTLSFDEEPLSEPPEDLSVPLSQELEMAPISPVEQKDRPLQAQVEEALDWSPSEPEPQIDEPAGESGAWGESADLDEPVGISAPEPKVTQRRGGVWMVVAVLLLLVAAAAGWWWISGDRDQTEPAPPTIETPVAEGSEEAPVLSPASEEQLQAAGDGPRPTETAASTGLEGSPIASPPVPSTTPSRADPAPVVLAPAEADSLRARYDQLARESVASARSVPYTVQFEIVCETSSVALALREGGSSVWFVPIQFRGRPCYRVFWGRHQTEAEARAAIAEIPESLRGSRPVVIEPGRIVE